MTGKRHARVSGIGSYLPPRVVTNDELSRMMDTSDAWITQRTGIKTRHWVDAETTTSDLALEASTRALARAGIAAGDVDLIVVATLSPDHEFPGTACFLQAKLGVPGIPAIDLRQQCTGFIYAVSVATSFIETGRCDRALVVGAEVHSKGLDCTTAGRDVAVLFGDAAGAVVLEACEVGQPADPHVLSTHLHADGRFARELWTEAPGFALGGERLTPEMLEARRHFPRMNGKQVFVNAVRRMPDAIREALDANGLALDDVDLVVNHQANIRINDAVAEALELPPEKVFNTIDRFANTTAATIPLGLDTAIAEDRLRPGMLVASAAFGSGFTWGSMLIRW